MNMLIADTSISLHAYLVAAGMFLIQTIGIVFLHKAYDRKISSYRSGYILRTIAYLCLIILYNGPFFLSFEPFVTIKKFMDQILFYLVGNGFFHISSLILQFVRITAVSVFFVILWFYLFYYSYSFLTNIFGLPKNNHETKRLLIVTSLLSHPIVSGVLYMVVGLIYGMIFPVSNGCGTYLSSC